MSSKLIVFPFCVAVLSSTKSILDALATNSSPPKIFIYARFSNDVTSISNPLPVPPILLEATLRRSPIAYPVPPVLTSTSVTCPAVTVMSAVAPEPDPELFVNATFEYTFVPLVGVYKLPPVMSPLSTPVKIP